MRAQMHSHGMVVVPGMLLGCHVGAAGPGDRVLVSSTPALCTPATSYVCMVVARRQG